MEVYCKDRSEWRKWLQENHDKEKIVWLIHYKKHTGKPTIKYDDAVEEAICFGWIDSIRKKIDEEKFMQKYTPRVDYDNWTVVNLTRAEKMMSAGLMTEAGLIKVQDALKRKDQIAIAEEKRKNLQLSPELELKFKSDETVWQNFNKLSPGQRRNYIMWIMEAKREETRLKRANEAIENLKTGKQLGLK